MKKNKKASATVVLGVVLILIVLGWGINRAGRECSSNEMCAEGYYCGSDFKCHQHPVITKEVPKNSLFWPSVMIGLAIVAGALILKKKRAKNPDHRYGYQTEMKR